MSDEYILNAYEPYEQPGELFRGTEEGLREYINKNLTTGAPFNGREFKNVKKISGYFLHDLDVLIQGPDVRSYIE